MEKIKFTHHKNIEKTLLTVEADFFNTPIEFQLNATINLLREIINKLPH